MIFNLHKPSADATLPHVAIVGAGFSGTLVLANLIYRLQGPLIINWFDESGEFGKGVAYSTTDIAHLLNVRADRMGAFAYAPDGFYRWCQSEAGLAQARTLAIESEIKPETFAPRALYACYLHSILEDALKQAQEKNITIQRIAASISDARMHNDVTGRLALMAESAGKAQEVMADALVLASGNLPPRRFRFQPGLVRGMERYVANVWLNGKGTLNEEAIAQLPKESVIVILGTGLTMVDTVLTLKRMGFKGTIHAISRRGWLPMPHEAAKPYPAWELTAAPHEAPDRLLPLYRRVRREITIAEGQGYGWRSVIDSLRPVTQTLWKRLSIAEKRKFMKIITLWNIHRHRMAPQIHGTLDELRQQNRLRIQPAKIYYVGSDDDGLTVAYRRRGENRIDTIRAELVLNCTGPEYDIAASTHKLLRNMRDKGLVTVGPLRIGIETITGGSAKGIAPDVIFPTGNLLVGELLECTAVPELRTQADEVSQAVVTRLAQLKDLSRNAHLLHGAWI